MTVGVTRHFPSSWRFTVTVERSGGRGPKGIPLPSTTHTVADCMIATQVSEEEARSDSPETTAWLYGPTGGDFRTGDVCVVPQSPLWVWGRFQTTGRPSFTPLGVRVPLREV